MGAVMEGIIDAHCFAAHRDLSAWHAALAALPYVEVHSFAWHETRCFRWCAEIVIDGTPTSLAFYDDGSRAGSGVFLMTPSDDLHDWRRLAYMSDTVSHTLRDAIATLRALRSKS